MSLAAGRQELPTRQRNSAPAPVRDGIGASVERPDGRLKVRGEFAYSSDLWADGMLWGVTVRSPHASARIRAIDIRPALRVDGVRAVLTHADVPGKKTYGLHTADQPVLAWDTIRYQGEAVAIVAADDPETARRAAARVVVEYEALTPLTDPELALGGEGPRLHPDLADDNVVKHVRIRHGDVERARASAEVVLRGEYEIGMQDHAFLGPESGLAIPEADGGVALYIPSQWLHKDQEQVALCLDLPPEKVRLTLAGVGGAFGGREDLSVHVHACMLALHTGRPVKMVYSREESFVGHVHRHPARLRYEHGATADGRLVYVEARVLLDGGAYESASAAVTGNAAYFAAGPYEVPNVAIDAYSVYTNNPPCGAMRGFGAVQSCFAYESQMERLAALLGLDPVELRARNAMRTGTVLPTGAPVHGPAPVEELLRRVQALPLPGGGGGGDTPDLRELPGGVSNTTHGEGVVRGVGYAVGIKAVGYSGGVDDYSTARIRLTAAGGEPLVEVHTAAAECGQGLVTVQAQIVRTELGVGNVVVSAADTRVGNAGSSSASRQTWMSGGAVRAACDAVRKRVLDRAAARCGRRPDELRLHAGTVVASGGDVVMRLADLVAGGSIEETAEYHHRPTQPLDPENGQGDIHVALAFAAQRAVVDVDVELGLVRVVDLATAEDVGRAINPQAIEGQIEGGSAQGLGLAVMEEIQLEGGALRNPSFTDYLIPTMLDMPSMPIELLEYPHPDSPYGLNGVGEPATLSSTPAIVNALRAATGLPLERIPVRPEDIAGRARTEGPLASV